MDWSTCSPDILLLIFKLLDDKSLLNCFSTCKLWRDLVDHIGKVNNIWPYMAQAAMYNRGMTFKQKSILPWRDLYFNSLLWNNRKAHLKVDKIIKVNLCYGLKDIHIFKDNLIVILDSVMKQYNVETLAVTYEESNVIDYQKTHVISGKLQDGNNLSLMFEIGEMNFKTNCHKFMLVDDSCFIIDTKNIFRTIKYCGEKTLKSTMMRSNDTFGAICCANMYHDDEINTYVLTQNGDIIRADHWQAVDKIICTITSPHFYNSPSVVHMFLKHSVVYNVHSENGLKFMNICEIGRTGEIVVECFGLTCAMSHDDVLFLGYQDGEVRVYLPKQMLRSKEPRFKFNIRDMVNVTLEDTAIRAIEVYEAKESHYLFVATRYVLVKIILTHK